MYCCPGLIERVHVGYVCEMWDIYDCVCVYLWMFLFPVQDPGAVAVE